MKTLVIALALGLSAAAARADVVTFDFESETTGSRTSLSMSSGGVSVGLSLTDSTSFTLQNESPFSIPASWGSRTLVGAEPNADGITPYFIANLTGTTVIGAELLTSDFNGDSDTVYFDVYSGANGGGSLLYTTTVTLPTTFDLRSPRQDVQTLSYSGSTAIGSIKFRGIGGTNSVFFDNLRLTTNTTSTNPTAVPLPPAGYAGIALLGAMGLLRMRKQRAQAQV